MRRKHIVHSGSVPAGRAAFASIASGAGCAEAVSFWHAPKNNPGPQDLRRVPTGSAAELIGRTLDAL
jgi:hypothetical protein